jgi:stress response protein SCP2
MLLDASGRVLEIVGPGHLRNANGSVIHTGDSRTGAGTWDDEQIFVFVHALPESVSTVTWVVMNTSDKWWSEIAGASCHFTDHRTGSECVRFDLTRLGDNAAHSVATMWRSADGWRLSAGPVKIGGALLAELARRVVSSKGRTQ